MGDNSESEEGQGQGQGTTCEVCGGLSFESSDGLFFCLECGTQSQDVREEKADENVEAASFVRTIKAPSTKKKSNPGGKGDGEVTLLQKMQFILQKQCDALISLGYDKSVKEAAKCIWFIYLKKFGYAFVDNTGNTNPPTPSTPLAHNRKRPRCNDDGDDPLPNTPKRLRPSADDDGMKAAALFDNFPPDDGLLDCSLDITVRDEGDDDVVKGNGVVKEGKRLLGNELFLSNRTARRSAVKNISIQYTIGVLYLALQYTNQRVLLPDFTRLVVTNKVPYYNLLTVLPAHFITPRHTASIYAKNQITSDRIHLSSQDLYKALPLPRLPLTDPRWVCDCFLDRLQLPGAFPAMVSRALDGVYWPEYRKSVDYEYVPLFRWREKRLDLECMALIVCVMKMVYGLDDVQEFEQASKSVAVDEESALLGGSGYVYPWEDWVTVFCRHKQHTLERSVPLNSRELSYVSDHQPFLDFCREEMLLSIRPEERPGDKGRRYRFCPDYYIRMSKVFGKVHQSYLRHQKKVAADKEGGQGCLYSWDDFKPRLIPCSALLDDHEHAPWKQYAPILSTSKDPKADFEGLPSSTALLLELCSDVVDTTPPVLMQYVRNVEWYIIQKVLPTFQQRATKQAAGDSATKGSQEPGTKGPQEPGTKRPQEPGTKRPQEPGTKRPQEPGTKRPQEPGTKRPQEPGTKRPQEPGTKRPQEPGTKRPQEPGTKRPQEPGTKRPQEPGTKRPQEPGTKRPQEPGTKRPQEPGTKRPQEPGTKRPQEPGTKRPQVPGTKRPQEPGTKQPQDGKKRDRKSRQPGDSKGQQPRNRKKEGPQPQEPVIHRQ